MLILQWYINVFVLLFTYTQKHMCTYTYSESFHPPFLSLPHIRHVRAQLQALSPLLHPKPSHSQTSLSFSEQCHHYSRQDTFSSPCCHPTNWKSMAASRPPISTGARVPLSTPRLFNSHPDHHQGGGSSQGCSHQRCL